MPHVMTMVHCLQFTGGYGLHFLVTFSFSLSLQIDYVVATFFNLQDLGGRSCLQIKCFIVNYCIIYWRVFI